MIADILVREVDVSFTRPNQTRQREDRSFDDLLAREDSQRAAPERTAVSERRSRLQEDSPNETGSEAEIAEPTENIRGEAEVTEQPTENLYGEAMTAEVVIEELVYYPTYSAEAEEMAVIDEEMEAEIVKTVSEIVHLPYEQIAGKLKEVEIKPQELAKPQEANKFMQAVLEVESPYELLAKPEYPQMLKDVAEAVKQLVEPQPEYEKISGMVVETDEDNQLIIKAPEAAPQAETADLTTLISTPREPRQTASQQYVPPVAEEAFVPETPVDTNRPNLAVNQAPQPIQQVPLEAAPVQAATPAASADPVQVMQQIMARVNTISAEGFAELKMTLKPESLGDVSLRIITQNGVVMAMFVAESQRIKEIIESNFNQLRYALEAQGIEVSQLFVSVGEDDSQQQMYEFLKAQQEAMRRLQRASGVLNEAEEVAVEEEILIDNTVSFTA